MSKNLIPIGSNFSIEFETLNDTEILIASFSKKARRFSNPIKAFEIIRDLGLEGGHFSVAQWLPYERELDCLTRPNKTKVLRTAHDSADLKRTLETHIKYADSPDAIWHDHDQLFDELKARYMD